MLVKHSYGKNYGDPDQLVTLRLNEYRMPLIRLDSSYFTS